MKRNFCGAANEAAMLLQNKFLCDIPLWRLFVEVFRTKADSVNRGWRCEFFGKTMRGAALVYAYTESEELYAVLTDAVRDMLTVAEEDGRVSTYTRETEYSGWDMWGRKYVLLGMQYYLDICCDEALRAEIIDFMKGCADVILAEVGPDKRDITETARHWYGMNSCSILEPMVKLYRLTGEKRYLNFATYIIERGGTHHVNIFELAYENKLLPYQYGVSKAYEMTSCFEGLLEYYYVTGIEKHRETVTRFAEAVLESELSIIGCSGTTHELFDHTVTRQTTKYDGVMQETCVTVTLMNFFLRMLALTDDSRYADAAECAFYNAYLGALNVEFAEADTFALYGQRYPDVKIKPTIVPFDGYSPLLPGYRGKQVGGFQPLPDDSYYGCCACIGAMGVGAFLQNSVVVDGTSVTVNFYERGNAILRVADTDVTLKIDTAYPTDGKVTVSVTAAAPVCFTLRLRIPAWADGKGGYTVYERQWHCDTVVLDIPMPLRIQRPLEWEKDTVYNKVDWASPGKFAEVSATEVEHTPENDKYFAVMRGPLTLAADSRTGKAADSLFSLPVCSSLETPEIVEGVPCLVRLRITPAQGESYSLVDYASAGRDWKTLIAAWLPTEE